MLFGSWFAIAKALPAPVVAPTAETSTTARRNPVRRETIVPAPMSTLARPMPLTADPRRVRSAPATAAGSFGGGVRGSHPRRRRRRRDRLAGRGIPAVRPALARAQPSTVRTTPSRRNPPTSSERTTMPTPSQSARTLTVDSLRRADRLERATAQLQLDGHLAVADPRLHRHLRRACCSAGRRWPRSPWRTSSRRSSGVAYSTTLTG